MNEKAPTPEQLLVEAIEIAQEMSLELRELAADAKLLDGRYAKDAADKWARFYEGKVLGRAKV